jgi:hypothetical protein
VLAKNDLLAEQNRNWLAERNILAFNITSSPGGGQDHTARALGRQQRGTRRPRHSSLTRFYASLLARYPESHVQLVICGSSSPWSRV